MKKEDPYLSELDAIDELGEEPAAGEAPTRVDFPAPPPEADDLEGTTERGGPKPVAGEAPVKEILSLSPDIPVQLVAVIGKKAVTVKDLLALRMGQVVDLERALTEAVDLVVAGKVIGKGELVEIDGKLGIRILKLLK